MIAYDNGDYRRGYEKAIIDLLNIFERESLISNYIKNKKQIIQFLKLYLAKSEHAIQAPEIKKLGVDEKTKSLVKLIFMTEEL